MTTSGVSSRRTFLKSAVASSMVITFPRPLRAQAKTFKIGVGPSGHRARWPSRGRRAGWVRRWRPMRSTPRAASSRWAA